MKPVTLLVSPMPLLCVSFCLHFPRVPGGLGAEQPMILGMTSHVMAPTLVPGEGGTLNSCPESFQFSLWSTGEKRGEGEKRGLKVNKQNHSNDLPSYSSLTWPH